MADLLQMDTYFQRLFIVTNRGRAAYKGSNWNEARKAYHGVTGVWVEEPTADAAEMLATLEGIINDAE